MQKCAYNNYKLLKIKLTYLFLLASLVSQAQLFKGLGFRADAYIGVMYSDTVDNRLYVGGEFKKLNGKTVDQVVYYDGIKWNSLDLKWKGGSIRTMTRFKGDIYFGGNYGINRWNGFKLDTLGKGANGYVGGLLNFNDSLLFVVGNFTKVDDTLPALGIATWNGNRWDTLPVNVPKVGSTNDFASIAYYKGEFYFGGNFMGKYGNDIIRFSGTEWKDVGGGLKGDSWVRDFEIYNGELYVAGEFKQLTGNPSDHVIRWDGTNWKPVGGGVNYQAWDLIKFKDNLFVCGAFDEAGGIDANVIAKWEGKEWCGYRNDFVNTVSDLAVYNDSLVVANGYFGPPSKDQVNILTDIHQTNRCGVIDGFSEIDVSDFKIYPNPVLAELVIEGSGTPQETDYKLINMQGQVLRSGNFLQLKFTINIEELVPGIYFLKLVTNNNNNRITKKIVKQ